MLFEKMKYIFLYPRLNNRLVAPRSGGKEKLEGKSQKAEMETSKIHLR